MELPPPPGPLLVSKALHDSTADMCNLSVITSAVSLVAVNQSAWTMQDRCQRLAKKSRTVQCAEVVLR